MIKYFKRSLLTTMVLVLSAGMISFSACPAPAQGGWHETVILERGVEWRGPSATSCREIVPTSPRRGVLIAYDGGGTYGG